MATAATASLRVPSPASVALAPARRAGWLLIASCLSLVLYLVMAMTVGADYEADLAAAAQASGTSIETLPARETARIEARHEPYSTVIGVVLVFPAALLAAAMYSLRAGLRRSQGAHMAWWLGLGSALSWYVYMALNAGLVAGPDHLPPLVDKLDMLGVPLVSVFAVLALAAVMGAGIASRRSGVAARIGPAAAIIAGMLLVLGIVVAAAAGFTEPVIPPLFIAPGILLGIGLVRSQSTSADAAADA
jgi:hypothetical protein